MKTTYVNEQLQIENKYASLITLIDTIYPTTSCTTSKLKRFLCLHPHCDQRFTTKGALRFHISKSHLIHHIKKPILDPIIEDIILTPSPPPSPFSSYKSPTSKKPTLSIAAEKLLNTAYPPLQCPCCHQSLNRKTNVIKHLLDTHTGQEPYRCIYNDCNHAKSYATREGLIYHIVRFHDK